MVTGDDTSYIELLKQELDAEFTTKNLGQMRYFLGLEVARSTIGILLNHRKYASDIVKDSRLKDCKSAKFPFPKGIKLCTLKVRF